MRSPLTSSPPFSLAVWMEVERGDKGMVEMKIEGTCRDGRVEIDHVTNEGRAAVLTTNEHEYAVELLESAAIDHGEDTFDFLPYFGPQD